MIFHTMPVPLHNQKWFCLFLIPLCFEHAGNPPSSHPITRLMHAAARQADVLRLHAYQARGAAFKELFGGTVSAS